MDSVVLGLLGGLVVCRGRTLLPLGDGLLVDSVAPGQRFINPKPRDLVSAQSRAVFNRPAIFAAVSAGKLGTEMPAWDKVLTPQEVANLSEYVFRTFTRPDDARLATRATP